MISTLYFTFFNFLIILLCNTQDILHVGQITTEFGAGFDCSNTDLFEYASETSPSGLSRTKYTISHPWLLNGDGKKFMVEYLIPNKKFNTKSKTSKTYFLSHSLIFIGPRSTTSLDSRIIFNIPVHAMNLNNIFVDVKRDIAISLYVGDSKMWFGFQEFVIKDADDSVLSPTTNDVSIASVALLNSGAISTGDGVTYRIIVTVPSGWSSFNTEVEGTAGKKSLYIKKPPFT